MKRSGQVRAEEWPWQEQVEQQHTQLSALWRGIGTRRCDNFDDNQAQMNSTREFERSVAGCAMSSNVEVVVVIREQVMV